MSTAASTVGTATFKGPAALSAGILTPGFLQKAFLVAATAFSTTAPAPAAITRYEDTARASLRPVGSTIRPVDPEEAAAVERIRELGAYDAGWNGADSIGPTRETVRQAIDFARQLTSFGKISRPYISLASDGEINFYWQTESGLTMDLGFTGTGRYSYFAETGDGREFIEDGAELGEPLPADLIVALRA